MSGRAKDLNATLANQYGMASTSVTAGGAGDGAAVLGQSIDTQGLGNRFASCAAVVAANATLAEGETLTIAAKLQHSPDGSAWSDLKDAADVITLTGGAGGSTEIGGGRIGSPLESAERYVRMHVTPTHSAAGVDSSVIQGQMLFGGPETLPVA